MTLRDRLLKIGTASLFEAAGKQGAMRADVKPLGGSGKLVGPALTIETPEGENRAIHEALTQKYNGEVLVVDGQGHRETALWGEVLTVAASAAGLSGLVLDGCARDGDGMSNRDFPIYGLGLAIPGPAKDRPGKAAKPIVCAGVSVVPGDWIVADADGVVVLPALQVEEITTLAEQREREESAMMQRLAAGETTTVDELGLSVAY